MALRLFFLTLLSNSGRAARRGNRREHRPGSPGNVASMITGTVQRWTSFRPAKPGVGIDVPFWGFVSHHLQIFVGDYIPKSSPIVGWCDTLGHLPTPVSHRFTADVSTTSRFPLKIPIKYGPQLESKITWWCSVYFKWDSHWRRFVAGKLIEENGDFPAWWHRRV